MILDPANPDKLKERSPLGSGADLAKQQIYLCFSFLRPLMRKVLFCRLPPRTSSDHIRSCLNSHEGQERLMLGVFIIHLNEIERAFLCEYNN